MKPKNMGAKLLKKWLADSGLKDFDAAVKLGLAPQRLRRYSNGAKPNLEAAVAIEDATGGLISVRSWGMDLDE